MIHLCIIGHYTLQCPMTRFGVIHRYGSIQPRIWQQEEVGESTRLFDQSFLYWMLPFFLKSLQGGPLQVSFIYYFCDNFMLRCLEINFVLLSKKNTLH